jgi:hypothetical protein
MDKEKNGRQKGKMKKEKKINTLRKDRKNI